MTSDPIPILEKSTDVTTRLVLFILEIIELIDE